MVGSWAENRRLPCRLTPLEPLEPLAPLAPLRGRD
jgi:hypothetical protein